MKEEEKSTREEEKSRWNSSSSLGTNDDKAKEDTYEAPVTSSSSPLSGNKTKSEWGACRTEAWQCFSSNMEVRFYNFFDRENLFACGNVFVSSTQNSLVISKK